MPGDEAKSSVFINAARSFTFVAVPVVAHPPGQVTVITVEMLAYVGSQLLTAVIVNGEANAASASMSACTKLAGWPGLEAVAFPPTAGPPVKDCFYAYNRFTILSTMAFATCCLGFRS